MRIEISVVTGTYNRLNYLQKMVESTRLSIGRGIPYEIIVVDGGSKDGTPVWCKSQPDIVFIQQGALLGAVKAFNAGFAQAKGRYVVIGNDDIEFVFESIQAAYAYMEDHKDVGIGCFYQDRGNREFHVELLAATRDGVHVSVPYGQVCIVPKWLGDKVGWWGNYTKTYGGDNELSCNIYELGYKIEPVPCACIHDKMPMDELRIKNTGSVELNKGQHPDSIAYMKKWLVGRHGPNIVSKPLVPNPLKRKLRILYAPIYEHRIRMQLTTKRGLRDALARRSAVSEVDYMNNPLLIFDVANMFKPDVFLLQLHNSDVFPINLMKELRQEHKDAVFVNWNGDYNPSILYSESYIRLMHEFDVASFVCADVHKKYKNWMYWQIGYEESDALPTVTTRKHDVLFLGNEYSEKRKVFGNMLRNLRGVNVGIYGDWKSIRVEGMNLYNFDEGQRLYMNCKIALGDCQWRDSVGYVSNRILQCLYAGTFMLQQSFKGMEKYTGLKNGVHLVTWDSIEEIPDLIKYWMKNEDKRLKIAKEGQEFVMTKHSFDVRVDELFKKLLSTSNRVRGILL
ncbi:MAG: glycosyltransferase [Candidatus Izemoplasmatales bacterium]